MDTPRETGCLLKARKNCLTCKARKIGCDRSLPTCQNCQRSRRRCAGYGLKLRWPEQADGRRKQKVLGPVNDSSVSRWRRSSYEAFRNGLPFLNTTYRDLNFQRVSVIDFLNDIADFERPALVARSLPTGLCDDHNDFSLLSYYESVLSRMITTIDDSQNGFRAEIMPMVMTADTKSSRSLLNAILAVSAVHLGRPEEALRYKLTAIQLLRASVNTLVDAGPAQLAACMMLCVYNVFDPTDFNWHTHLRGAQAIRTRIVASSSNTFLSSWFEYHQVLQEYCEVDKLNLEDDLQIIVPESDDETRCHVIGALGCSQETLDLISCTNRLRRRQASTTSQTDSRLISSRIRQRLSASKQSIRLVPQGTGQSLNLRSIEITAELYRIAACLYLEQVASSESDNRQYIGTLICRGFSLLHEMEVCTSPWPLFILASHSTDEHRGHILRMLEVMQNTRRIGNISVLELIIQALWKQQDLAGDTNKDPSSIDWRRLVAMDSPMPSFV